VYGEKDKEWLEMKAQMENMEKKVESDIKAFEFERESQSNHYNNTIHEVTEVVGYRSTQSSHFSFEPINENNTKTSQTIVFEENMVRNSY